MAASDHPPGGAPVPSLAGGGAIVLGGGQGMGEATVRKLTAAGATVACVDIDPDRAAAIATDVGGVAIEADVTDRASLRTAFERVAVELPPLVAVVDVVGMASWGAIKGFGEDDWQRDLALNLKHVWHCLALSGEVMANGGGIVCIASVSGITGAAEHSLYGAAKAAVMSLVRSGAVELAPSGIRVNAISPGAVLTPRIRANQSPELLERQAEHIPLGRLAAPEDIADLAVFLVSERSAYITGATIVIDGGVSAVYPYLTPGSRRTEAA